MTDCRDMEPRWYTWAVWAGLLLGVAVLVALLGVFGTAVLWALTLLVG